MKCFCVALCVGLVVGHGLAVRALLDGGFWVIRVIESSSGSLAGVDTGLRAFETASRYGVVGGTSMIASAALHFGAVVAALVVAFGLVKSRSTWVIASALVGTLLCLLAVLIVCAVDLNAGLYYSEVPFLGADGDTRLVAPTTFLWWEEFVFRRVILFGMSSAMFGTLVVVARTEVPVRGGA